MNFRHPVRSARLIAATMVTGMLLPSMLWADLIPQAKVCAECHGEDGAGVSGLGPRLAGLSANYIREQVRNFQLGNRQNVTMHGLAMAIKGDDLDKAVNYFASQPVQPFTAVLRGEITIYFDDAERLAYRGDWSRTLPACVTCHGASGIGVGDIPRLAGQERDYLQRQMTDWQNGQRKGDSDNVMGSIANKLTADEIAALARYFSGIGHVQN